MMPDEKRFRIRQELESAGAICDGYGGNGFQLSIARGKFEDVQAVAVRNGLHLLPNSLNYWPLGSDRVPEEFRHECPPRYTIANGFNRGWRLCCTWASPEPMFT